jgi:hypothetical protein
MKTFALVLLAVLTSTYSSDIPKEVYAIAKKGNKVYIQSHDEHAVVHATNAIESWGYWNVTQDPKKADFILKFHLRFEGAGVCIVNATFINPRSENVIYSTPEATSVKKAKGFDFNTKRSALRQIVEQEFKPNFK